MINDENNYEKLWMISIQLTVKNSDDLKKASRENPQYFWKILGGHQRTQQPNIDIKTLYYFFLKI